MNKITHKKVILATILTCIIICIPLTIIVINNNNKEISFEMKKDGIIKDYSVTIEDKTVNGLLYEQDVLFTGKFVIEKAEEYLQNIDIPKGTVALNIKFYSSYDINSDKQKENSLIYEIQKVIKNT